MGFFDELLARVPAEDQAVLNKYPELKQSITKMETDLGQISRYANGWATWERDNWDQEAGMTKAEKALQDELAAAQARLTTATAAGSGASEATITQLRKDFETKAKEIEGKSLQAIEGMNMFYEAAAKRMLPHFNEFKENLDPRALREYMAQNKINDPDLAYDKMVAGKRAELAATAAKELEAKHAADLEAARAEGYQKRAQEVAMGPGGVLPTDSTGGIAGITARIDKPATISDDVKAVIEKAKPGDGSLAELGYKLYREGAFSAQQ